MANNRKTFKLIDSNQQEAKMKTLSIITLALLLTACGSNPTKVNRDLTDVKPSNPQVEAKAFLAKQLKDPSSATYRFEELRVEECRRTSIMGFPFKVWALTVYVNAKNSYGGYVGEKETKVFFSKGKAMDFAQRRDGKRLANVCVNIAGAK